MEAEEERERKEKLAIIKAKHRSIPLSELREHLQSVDQQLQDKLHKK